MKAITLVTAIKKNPALKLRESTLRDQQGREVKLNPFYQMSIVIEVKDDDEIATFVSELFSRTSTAMIELSPMSPLEAAKEVFKIISSDDRYVEVETFIEPGSYGARVTSNDRPT